ncbi:MAG: Crp/Fnr family transcriptional regulator [Dokdonella sp.]
MSAAPVSPPANRLLATLPVLERQRFLDATTRVELAFADVLYNQGDQIAHVYFPITGFISMLTTVDQDSTIEVGMVGNEGMSGFGLLLDGGTSTVRAAVQGSGSALRIDARSFRRCLKDMPTLHQILSRYVLVLMTQLARTVACTRFHVVEQRLARWLLMTRDRAQADSFAVTQEFLAHMLGVRRVGVTAAARILQSKNLIRYSRGRLHILDGVRLENAACECYRCDLDTYDGALTVRARR